ncbi:Uncharacterized conserved protein [Plasmopara halstedii]|uniref:Uncharacterized conserved protein n=1 Tax=Plasmopara halstedii TaxID=4781 RepID=A0A0P1AN44_PLAHL|nr:Uncharacterized conserved protein [Plasmopara halstedii]CEG42661.1 Uncharacterized conserved protein [Plasmopara halstedii]|eukprot:XP_024579030.1 Uncharacterized conserved protein [Plasmopara halstedii]
MNFGIINNRRPDARPSSVNALLEDPRMREIAKQMGLQPKDFGNEAKALWSTLNKLSTSDPKRYQSFINEQLQDGPPPSESPSHECLKDAAPPRFFTPDPGYVVKCMMYHTIKCQRKVTKLFLNICGHKLIDVPNYPNSGREVPEDTRVIPNTNNLQVPLVVGKLREHCNNSGELCCVIDVVVNPWVLRRSDWDANFKREVMKLAIQWVQEDANVTLVIPSGKFIKARYKSGVMVGNEIITSKFRIEDADKTKQRIESPGDLLKQIKFDETKADEKLVIEPPKQARSDQKQSMTLHASTLDDSLNSPKLVMKAGTGIEKKKVLIEELPSPPTKNQTALGISTPSKTANSQHKRKSKSAVKRGFLNSTTSQLYPMGSNEGRPSSAYVNLLSRSKVVDLTGMDQQQKSKQDEHEEAMNFLKPARTAETTKKHSVTASEEIDHGDHIFEQLCEQAESDFGFKQTPSQHNGSNDTSYSDQLFGEGFEELAKLLAP